MFHSTLRSPSRCFTSGSQALAHATALLLLLTGFHAAVGAEPVGGNSSTPAPTPAQLDHFEQRVRPILASQCIQCHGAKRQRGELRLDSRAALLRGGDSGPAIELGKPESSLLIAAVKHESLVMPPEGRLTAAEIESLTHWIRDGAPWPVNQHTLLAQSRVGRGITAEDRTWWAFQPLAANLPPTTTSNSWSLSPIDRFIAARLEQEQLQPAAAADKATLLRRLSFDLTGLAPTSEQFEDYLADEQPDAYERQVDRLLASPRHGERWARHWLDLVRYAESDGFKQDDYRPHAWHYRDYVVQSLNADKPYDQFIREQLAGDELAPDDAEAQVATGFLRHWIYEYNQRDVRGQWTNILNDVTDVTADVFLAMGLGCARCHDHKYDPILQRDYFRLQAFFAPLVPRDDRSLATAAERADYAQRMADWERKTADIRAEMTAIEQQIRSQTTQSAIDKFPKDIRPMLRKSRDERAPLEQQLAELANRQVTLEQVNLKMESRLKDETKERWVALKKRLDEYAIDRPAPLPVVNAVSDVGTQAPPTIIPGGREGTAIEPGFLSILDPAPAVIEPLPSLPSTGRRSALANWLTQPKQPLTPRVAVNRLWQYHFGRGLVKTASDFGRLGEPPTHPELLDWLASELLQHDWQWKPLHRQLVTSATYRQAAVEASPTAKLRDPDNRLWWRMNVRRLDAEQIRDALLQATGELDLAMGGPSAEWSRPRRSVFTRVIRNQRDPLLDVFDSPDHIISTAERNVTTTPNQALLMMNGKYLLDRAQVLAQQVARTAEAASTATGASTATEGTAAAAASERPVALVQALYRRVLGREPTATQLTAAVHFLQSAGAEAQASALTDLAHVLLNTNEFLYVD